MGTKKWAEIKRLSRATEADRAEARAELEAEVGSAVPASRRRIEQILDHAGELAKRFEEFDPAQGREVPVEEYLARRRTRDTTECPCVLQGGLVNSASRATTRKGSRSGLGGRPWGPTYRASIWSACELLALMPQVGIGRAHSPDRWGAQRRAKSGNLRRIRGVA